LAAADKLAQGSLEEEKPYLALAALGSVFLPTTGTAYLYFGAVLVSQGGSRRVRPGSSAPRAVRPEAEPAVAVAVHPVRGCSSWLAAITPTRWAPVGGLLRQAGGA
jgi:hypothetical protein